MSADNPASSGEDHGSPAGGQPDRRPDNNPGPEQPVPAADAGQPGSNRSRAEYAATLRTAGWDAQPQSPPVSTDRAQPIHPATDQSQRSQATDTTTTPRDSDPPQHEQASRPDTRQLPAADHPPPAEPQPPAARDTEPATTRQPDQDARAQLSDGLGSRDPGIATPDVPPSAEAGDGGQPTDTEKAATPATEQPSRTDYATGLRAHAPWSAAGHADQPDHPDSKSPTEVTQASPAAASEYANSDAAESSGPDTGMLEQQDTEPAEDTFQGPAALHERHAAAPAGEFILPDRQDTSASGASHDEPPVTHTAETGAEAATPEKIYVEGREILITHDPADGMWVKGLPGEIPGTPIGDPHGTAKIGEYLGGERETADLEKVPRGWGAFQDVSERLDDIDDALDQDVDLVQKLFDARPRDTHASVVHDYGLGAATSVDPHGVTFAHGVEGLLVMAVLAAKLKQLASDRRKDR